MFAYVGCRTTKERNARGEGVRVFRIEDGNWHQIQILRDLVNPSFLILGRGGRCLYAVHGDFSEVSSFAVDEQDGTLTFLNQRTTGGRNPVHLGLDADERHLVVANFATGSLALFPIGTEGALGPCCDLVTLPGEPGPHRREQKGSHPHQVLFEPRRRWFLTPDKGVDRIFVATVDAAAGKLVIDETLIVTAREGAAPRHGVFHPHRPFLYVANELDSTVSTFGYDGDAGRLTALEIISTLPPGCLVTSHAAGIAITPDGRYVFVSNRGHDSVSTFAVDAEAATLRRIFTTPSGGRKPRFITLDPSGGRLLVANEDSDTIRTFGIGGDGRLSECSDPLMTGSPVCIVFAAPRAAGGQGPAA